MKNLALRLLSLILFMTIPMLSSCGGNDEPNNPNNGDKSASELKVQYDVSFSTPVNVKFTVMRGAIPSEIKRDGVVVVNKDDKVPSYISEQTVSKLSTTFSLFGDLLPNWITITPLEDTPFPCEGEVLVKTYRRSSLLETQKRKVIFNGEFESFFEGFGVD